MMEEIRSEICAQYRDLSTYAPPAVMCWMKKDASTVPRGFSPPKKAAAMPLKPMAGTEEVEHCHCS